LKVKAVSSFFMICSLIWLVSCGGGDSNSATVSGLSNRAFVSNSQTFNMQIIDANNDQFSTKSAGISVSTGVGLMALSPDKTKTLTFGSITNTISVIDNTTETVVASVTLGSFTESMAFLSDNKTALAAVRNEPVSGAPNGAVLVLDTSTPALTATIPVPSVQTVIVSHNGNRALAFSDGTDSMAVIDTSAHTATTVPGFDRPVYGVFSSDDTKAYILSCGPECGGTTAKVTVLDMSSNTPGASVNVSAATVGAMDTSGNLYVAGTAGAAGKLDVVNTGSLSVSKSGVAITDGFHTRMLLVNTKLYIGARTCTTPQCLTVFDTGAQTAIIAPCVVAQSFFCTPGDVTGFTAIDKRNVVYVIEGGKLLVYDLNSSTPLDERHQLDIVGNAVDVKNPD